MSNHFGNVDNVILKDYDASYFEQFKVEKELLLNLFGEDTISIEHVGSTAITNIKSKPIIDIAILLKSFPLTITSIEELQKINYVYWCTNPNLHHQFFFKGLPRTHHLHFYPLGYHKYEDQIIFRNFLLNNDDKAKEYECLKIELAHLYKDDREKYSEMKADFVESVLSSFKEKTTHNICLPK